MNSSNKSVFTPEQNSSPQRQRGQSMKNGNNNNMTTTATSTTNALPQIPSPLLLHAARAMSSGGLLDPMLHQSVKLLTSPNSTNPNNVSVNNNNSDNTNISRQSQPANPFLLNSNFASSFVGNPLSTSNTNNPLSTSATNEKKTSKNNLNKSKWNVAKAAFHALAAFGQQKEEDSLEKKPLPNSPNSPNFVASGGSGRPRSNTATAAINPSSNNNNNINGPFFPNFSNNISNLPMNLIDVDDDCEGDEIGNELDFEQGAGIQEDSGDEENCDDDYEEYARRRNDDNAFGETININDDLAMVRNASMRLLANHHSQRSGKKRSPVKRVFPNTSTNSFMVANDKDDEDETENVFTRARSETLFSGDNFMKSFAFQPPKSLNSRHHNSSDDIIHKKHLQNENENDDEEEEEQETDDDDEGLEGMSKKHTTSSSRNSNNNKSNNIARDPFFAREYSRTKFNQDRHHLDQDDGGDGDQQQQEMKSMQSFHVDDFGKRIVNIPRDDDDGGEGNEVGKKRTKTNDADLEGLENVPFENNNNSSPSKNKKKKTSFQNTVKDRFEGYIKKAERERKDHFWVISDSLQEGILMKKFENADELCEYFHKSVRRKFLKAINQKHYYSLNNGGTYNYRSGKEGTEKKSSSCCSSSSSSSTESEHSSTDDESEQNEKIEENQKRREQKRIEREEKREQEINNQLNTFVWIDVQTTDVLSMLKIAQLFPFLRRETFSEAAMKGEPSQVFQHNTNFDYYFCQLSCPGHRIAQRKRKQQLLQHLEYLNQKQNNNDEVPVTSDEPNSSNFYQNSKILLETEEFARQNQESKIENCCGPQISRCCKSNRTKVSIIVASSLVITFHVEPFRGLGSFLKQVHNQVARPRDNITQALLVATQEYLKAFLETQQQLQQEMLIRQEEDDDNDNDDAEISTRENEESDALVSATNNKRRREKVSTATFLLGKDHDVDEGEESPSCRQLPPEKNDTQKYSFASNKSTTNSRRNSLRHVNNNNNSFGEGGSNSAPVFSTSTGEFVHYDGMRRKSLNNPANSKQNNNNDDDDDEEETDQEEEEDTEVTHSASHHHHRRHDKRNKNSFFIRKSADTRRPSAANVSMLNHPQNEEGEENSTNRNSSLPLGKSSSTQRFASPASPSSPSPLKNKTSSTNPSSSAPQTILLEEQLQIEIAKNNSALIQKNIVQPQIQQRPDTLSHHRAFRRAHRMVDAAIDDDDLHHASEGHYALVGSTSKNNNNNNQKNDIHNNNAAFLNPEILAAANVNNTYAERSFLRQDTTQGGGGNDYQKDVYQNRQFNIPSNRRDEKPKKRKRQQEEEELASPLALLGHTIPNLPRMTSGWILASLIQLVVENSIPDLTGASDKVSEVEESIFKTSVEIDDTTQVANVENMKIFQDLVSGIGQVRRLSGELYTDFIQKSVLLQTILAPRYASHQTLWGKMYSRALLRQATVNLGRSIEQLDSIREHLTQCSTNVQGKISIAQMEASIRMDSQSRRLSQVATICLPLSLLVGIFGVNVPVPYRVDDSNQDLTPFTVIIIVCAVWFCLAFVYIYRQALSFLFFC